MKRVASVLALSLLILLSSCAKQPNTAHLSKPKPLAVLVEEVGNVTTFTTPKDIGGEDVQLVVASLLLYVPGVESVAAEPRTITVWHNATNEKNKTFLKDEIKRILKIKFEVKEIVFINANDYPDEEEFAKVVAEALLNTGS